jgi:hypothetical protein
MGGPMPRKKKPAHQLTDKELTRRVFPAHVRKQVKAFVKSLEKTGRKQRKTEP